jgi:hypothetical protein
LELGLLGTTIESLATLSNFPKQILVMDEEGLIKDVSAPQTKNQFTGVCILSTSMPLGVLPASSSYLQSVGSLSYGAASRRAGLHADLSHVQAFLASMSSSSFCNHTANRTPSLTELPIEYLS